MQSLFERAGGFPKVSKIVSRFYDRVLDDPQLSPFFAGVDMKRQIDHQTKFVSFLLGGPTSYSDDHIERVHARLGITLPDFDVMVTTMCETLEDHGFADTEVSVVEQELRRREGIIVTKR